MDASIAIKELEGAIYCGDFFSKSEIAIKNKYREYAKLIHPDVCKLPNAEAAFQKLNELYSAALEAIQNGTWKKKNCLQINNEVIEYKNESHFELGMRYSGSNKLVFIFDPDKSIWCNRFIASRPSLANDPDKMKKIYSCRMPRFIKRVLVSNGASQEAIILAKEPSEYPFDLFLKTYENQLDGRDIAWMISRMIDLCCFLYTHDIVHNGITIDSLYIDPEQHSMHLYGGWQYAVPIGGKMTGTTKEIYNLMSSVSKTTKEATPTTDIESVKLIARMLCKKAKDIPIDILKWADSGSSDDPIKEYRNWNDTLTKAYGTRQFKIFHADAVQIYSEK